MSSTSIMKNMFDSKYDIQPAISGPPQKWGPLWPHRFRQFRHPSSGFKILWQACPKWQGEGFPLHAAFTAVPNFYFLRPTSIAIL